MCIFDAWNTAILLQMQDKMSKKIPPISRSFSACLVRQLFTKYSKMLWYWNIRFLKTFHIYQCRKTLVALYKLKPLQNLTWGNVFSPASDGSSLYTITNIEVVYLLYIYTSFPTLWLGTDHLTCRFFVSFRNFFSDNTRVRIFNFFVAFQNLTLGYMTKTLNQIFFFLHQNQNIFFSNIGNQNIFLDKKPYPPPLQVKWSFPKTFNFS
jgi:hypothetical protein